MMQEEVRKRILGHLSLKDLHRCCIVARKLAGWAKPHIDASPVVLLFGGMTSDWCFVDRPIIVDPRGGRPSWHQIGPLLRPRSRAGVVGLSGRRVLVAGGLSLKDSQASTLRLLLLVYRSLSDRLRRDHRWTPPQRSWTRSR